MDDDVARVPSNPLSPLVIRIIDVQLLQKSRRIAIEALSQLAFQECGCKHVCIIQITSARPVSGEQDREIRKPLVTTPN